MKTRPRTKPNHRQTDAAAHGRRARRLLRSRIGQAITVVILSVIGFFYLYPLLWMLGSALKTNREFFKLGMQILPAGSWNFHNFVEAWTTAQFGQYFINTVFVTTCVVVGKVLFSSMLGYVLARTDMPGKRLLFGLMVGLMFIPAGYTIVPFIEVVRALGILNTIWALIVPAVLGGLLFEAFLYTGYFAALPRELEESARIDGANFPQVFRYIAFPLAAPMSATVALLAVMNTWNDFFTPLVLVYNRPELRTLAVGMYAFVDQNTRDWVLTCAAAVITILPLVIVFLFLQRYFVDGIAGAVK
ncbi:carbohydrate ABC transporter permease [Candidatus Gracilibacteria bacterium]|nr:carbohydrate ABC transporter permease [Candidatus Gracilibacteria bacterium]